MSISKNVSNALSDVFDARSEAESLCKAFELLDVMTDNPFPPVFRAHVDRWAAACDRLEDAVRGRAVEG